MSTLTRSRKPVLIEKDKFFKLLNKFIIETIKGRRTRANGKKLNNNSIQNYLAFKRLLSDFINETNFEIRLYRINKLSDRDLEMVSKYWKSFYNSFTDYLYIKCDYYDNYVWVIFRVLKTFFNYLNKDCHLGIGEFHKTFHIPAEDIPIVVLSPDQLNRLIYDKTLSRSIPKKLERPKDIFVFGCTVALRFSDLVKITHDNLYHFQGGVYLKVTSSKTSIHTTIKLPEYAIDIIRKYESKKRKTLFPFMTNSWLNKKLKELANTIDMKDEMIRYRSKRGIKKVVYKDKIKRKHYTIGDHFTTHTMRRTAITNMLRLGVPEQIVRKISGHTANSAEFFKYVEYAQNYLDEHTEEYFNKMKQMK